MKLITTNKPTTFRKLLKTTFVPICSSLAMVAAIAVPSLAAANDTTIANTGINDTSVVQHATSSEPEPSIEAQAQININQADIDDLTALHGIGKKKAAAIIEYRNENGAFTDIEDLAEVKGIGRAIVDKNRTLIAL